MRDHGFTVTVFDAENLAEIKERYKIPAELQSCHTAIVDGYLVEGHVPVADVERMLKERPAVAGIGVGGMPIGSPGMDVPGSAPQPYDVMAFDAAGNLEVFASYRP